MTEAAHNFESLKDEFIRSEGYWTSELEIIARRSPGYFAVYLGMISVASTRNNLTPKLRELIGAAINASVTHMNIPAMRVHVTNALRHGATQDEIAEVFQLISAIGTHSMSIGIPVLLDELQKAGHESSLVEEPLTEEQEALKADFMGNRGYWIGHWADILRVCPEYFKAYKAFSSYPWRHGVLEPKVKEFIYVAVDVSTTHLYERGMRIHIRNALAHGATRAELVDVMVVASMLGLQASYASYPTLLEIIEGQGGLAG